MGGEEWENVRERLVKVGGREEVSVCMSGRLVKVGGREEVSVCMSGRLVKVGGREAGETSHHRQGSSRSGAGQSPYEDS